MPKNKQPSTKNKKPKTHPILIPTIPCPHCNATGKLHLPPPAVQTLHAITNAITVRIQANPTDTPSVTIGDIAQYLSAHIAPTALMNRVQRLRALGLIHCTTPDTRRNKRYALTN